ncbi:RNA polymerase sigma factor [Gemmatimonadetes bacterium T265]|nr:RNA polymerase sigma factor [Gemmatimonadetes bacterium T265]
MAAADARRTVAFVADAAAPPAGAARTDAGGDVPDAVLVEGAAAGDREAFGALVRRHLAAARGAALSVLGDPADADDCAQDAFVTALTRIEECRPAEKFRAWLLVIVRNRAIDLRRRARVRRAESLDDDDRAAGLAGALATGGLAVGASGAGTLDAAERADARAHLRAALASLTETRRAVVVLHDVEGWTHREIGDHLGIAEGTVRAHLFWARRALRERLSAEWRRGADG